MLSYIVCRDAQRLYHTGISKVIDKWTAQILLETRACSSAYVGFMLCERLGVPVQCRTSISHLWPHHSQFLYYVDPFILTGSTTTENQSCKTVINLDIADSHQIYHLIVSTIREASQSPSLKSSLYLTCIMDEGGYGSRCDVFPC